jgi:hypothetical protein
MLPISGLNNLMHVYITKNCTYLYAFQCLNSPISIASSENLKIMFQSMLSPFFSIRASRKCRYHTINVYLETNFFFYSGTQKNAEILPWLYSWKIIVQFGHPKTCRVLQQIHNQPPFFFLIFIPQQICKILTGRCKKTSK